MSKDMDTARCPDCGSLLVLVGLHHLYRPRPARAAGRPPVGARAMTAAERQRRRRAAQRKMECVRAPAFCYGAGRLEWFSSLGLIPNRCNGRPKGSKNKATVQRNMEEAEAAKKREEETQSTEMPLEFMLKNMRDPGNDLQFRAAWPRRLRHSAIRSCRQWLTGIVTGTATTGRFRISSRPF